MKVAIGARSWIQLGLFLRFPLLGTILGPTLLGAATSSGRVSLAEVGILLLVGLLYHIPSVLVNDLRDLKIDRNDPMRAGSPLVEGIISPRSGWYIAACSTAAVLIISGLSTSRVAAILGIVVGLSSMTAYNFFGKRKGFSLLTDVILGFGYAAPALFAAVYIGQPSKLTYYLCIALIVYTLLVNAYGGLRDLAADGAGGGYTTAMSLGALEGGSIPIISRRFSSYVCTLHVAIMSVCVLAVATESIDHPGLIIFAACCIGVGLYFAGRGLWHSVDSANMHVFGAASLTAVFGGISALSAAVGQPLLAAAGFVLFLLPMPLNPGLRVALTARVFKRKPIGDP